MNIEQTTMDQWTNNDWPMNKQWLTNKQTMMDQWTTNDGAVIDKRQTNDGHILNNNKPMIGEKTTTYNDAPSNDQQISIDRHIKDQ